MSYHDVELIQYPRTDKPLASDFQVSIRLSRLYKWQRESKKNHQKEDKKEE